ncbi:anthranilate synthase component II [Burkholderia ubonensis]|uniref:Aminodeoxychorismate/anthranilate synthase component II n=1 Tax=Burkholderia ubonensis subsp. mesacidophila TaxID=265293 RepID=A0A2A4FC28_9BURK|nr:aminodeoxychorismate/anthranilate synthase component II [Burkholderia ubonensis]PCE30210.1 aminodeoxychorismate/anthranilate synthase component II [Burkholderia ubonensis subsp. mesacidophila]
MNVALVDAYDSFVYVIDLYLRTMGLQTRVLRCDDPRIDRLLAEPPSAVVLGPGPGRPEDAGYPQMIRALEGRVPVMGVCLGHQAIGLAYGGEVVRAGTCMHGKTSVVANDGTGVFAKTSGKPFSATRYHSLVIARDSVPDPLVVSAHALDDNEVMGVRHRRYPIEGVQFHPESISTENGMSIFSSFFEYYLGADAPFSTASSTHS